MYSYVTEIVHAKPCALEISRVNIFHRATIDSYNLQYCLFTVMYHIRRKHTSNQQ